MDRRRVPGARSIVLFTLLAALLPAGVLAQQAADKPAEPAPLRVVPYGIVYFNLFSNDGGSNNGDVPLWAVSGPGNVSASARQSRFGFRVTGATFGSARVSAVVEADFFGGYPAVGIGDNMGVLRLRLAHARIDGKRASLVVGQDWMIFAPANPASLSAAGIPLLAATGNPWSRLPQIRGEWKTPALLLQGALLAPSTGDFSSAFFYQPGSGALSQQPFLQGRAAYTLANVGGTKKAATLAISGHFGRSRVVSPVDGEVDSRAVAADWSVPLGRILTLSGEAFAGRNLAAFQAGVFQGLAGDGAVASGGGLLLDGPRAIRTRGGWAQLTATVTPTVTANGAFGLDDPVDEDFLTMTRREARLRNAAVSVGVQHKATAQITWGVEVRRMSTGLLVAGRKTNTHANLAVTFTF